MRGSRPAGQSTSPRWGAGGIVDRPALYDVLHSGVKRGVTVISASPGSGKTVLLRSWLSSANAPARVAWVSTERGERDAQSFWMSVLDALSRGAGDSMSIERPTAGPDFDGDELVTRLLTALAPLKDRLVLIIDDLHELLSAEACRQLERFLRGRPVNLSVILATRRDLPLGLHLLRLSGQLTELRSADLRFSLAEARQFLGAANLVVDDDDVRRLYERTEGWVAGLRLAALALDGHPNPGQFIAAFSGSERTVADYLLTEVLERQPASTQKLLLRTSVLGRICGPLTDALTGGSGAEAILREMEVGSAFVVSLDTDRTWFRYHHLFGDLLYMELRRTRPDEVAPLHRAAARWYAEQGQALDAVRHAQAAGDWGAAIKLLSDHSVSLTLDGHRRTIHSVLAEFPGERVPLDPALAILIADDELAYGSLAEAEGYLAVAERHVDRVSRVRNPRMGVALALTRLVLARKRGDLSLAMEQVPCLLSANESQAWGDPRRNLEIRALALMELGVVERWASRTDDAIRHLEEGRELARRAGRPYLEIGCLAHLASTITSRSFTRAQKPCREAIAIAEQHGWGEDPVITPALATLGVALMQAGGFDEAQIWLQRAHDSVRPETEPSVGLMIYLAQGTLHFLGGRPLEAMRLYREAERMQMLLANSHPLKLQLSSNLIQVLVQLGDREAAKAMLTAMADEERTSGECREAAAVFELADQNPRAASETLAPVLAGSVPMHHRGALIRALLVEALAQDRLGDAMATESAVERALDLAEPDGLILPFVLLPTQNILERPRQSLTNHAAFLAVIREVLTGSSRPLQPGIPAACHEVLSPSEIRVLRHLGSNLRAWEIAADLNVSVHTVKTHMRHIYSKLDVHTRNEAVSRARELRLLAPQTFPAARFEDLLGRATRSEALRSDAFGQRD